jgi:hypothetical protein
MTVSWLASASAVYDAPLHFLNEPKGYQSTGKNWNSARASGALAVANGNL